MGTCILDVAVMDVDGPNYGLMLSVGAAKDKVTVVHPMYFRVKFFYVYVPTVFAPDEYTDNVIYDGDADEDADSYNVDDDDNFVIEARDEDDIESDTFWPIVAALVIGIPSIIVFGIAITVIHKRRLASPARLRAASMYPSL
nr:hypothetical protein BaRGS_010847 [Batillaria attramentaria]